MILRNILVKAGSTDAWGLDARAYWAFDLADPYTTTVGGELAFLYSPPIAYFFAAFHRLSWEAFAVLWTVVDVAALVWLARRWTVVLLALPPVFNELFYLNVNLLIGVAIVVGFRWPASWAFVILTKVTPGVGLVWFAARREWRRLAIALSVSVAIAAGSFLLTPDLWRSWIALLGAGDPRPHDTALLHVPLAARLALAAGAIALGARLNHRWVVPVGAAIALPVVWSAGLSIMAATIPLLRDEVRERAVDHPGGSASSPNGHPRPGWADGEGAIREAGPAGPPVAGGTTWIPDTSGDSGPPTPRRP